MRIFHEKFQCMALSISGACTCGVAPCQCMQAREGTAHLNTWFSSYFGKFDLPATLPCSSKEEHSAFNLPAVGDCQNCEVSVWRLDNRTGVSGIASMRSMQYQPRVGFFMLELQCRYLKGLSWRRHPLWSSENRQQSNLSVTISTQSPARQLVT